MTRVLRDKNGEVARGKYGEPILLTNHDDYDTEVTFGEAAFIVVSMLVLPVIVGIGLYLLIPDHEIESPHQVARVAGQPSQGRVLLNWLKDHTP